MEMWKEKAATNPMVYLTRQTLCKSEAGNAVPLLTITDSETKEVKFYFLSFEICKEIRLRSKSVCLHPLNL